MNVLVDTSVWSLALRRGVPTADPHARELAELITAGRVLLIGPIRQELLSGIRHESQWKRLRDDLRAFPDLALRTDDHERAAQYFNQCRAAGIQGSNTDFLICAVATLRGLAIFTTDQDFDHFGRVLTLKLHRPRR